MTSASQQGSLDGKAFLVTRAAEQSNELAQKLEQLGATVYSLPVTAIRQPKNWHAVDSVISQLESFDWLLFVSTNAVTYFMQRCKELDAFDKVKGRLAAVGPATAFKLQSFGFADVFVPQSSYTAESLIEEFTRRNLNLAEQKILCPRGNLGRTVLVDRLRMLGARAEAVECYENVLPDEPEKLAAELSEILAKPALQGIIFASSQSVINLSIMLDLNEHKNPHSAEDDVGSLAVKYGELERAKIISIGPETSSSCAKYFGRVDIEAKAHTLDGLVQALSSHFSKE